MGDLLSPGSYLATLLAVLADSFFSYKNHQAAYPRKR